MEDCLIPILLNTNIKTLCCFNQLCKQLNNYIIYQLAYQQWYHNRNITQYKNGTWYQLLKQCFQLEQLSRCDIKLKPLYGLAVESIYLLKRLKLCGMKLTTLP